MLGLWPHFRAGGIVLRSLLRRWAVLKNLCIRIDYLAAHMRSSLQKGLFKSDLVALTILDAQKQRPAPLASQADAAFSRVRLKDPWKG